jgi:hypothetical protein
MSAAKVPAIVSSQSAIAQTTSKTLSFTPTVSGVYRLNAYAVISSVPPTDMYNLQFGWTDDHKTWTWGPNSGPGINGATNWFAQPMSALVRAVSGHTVSLIYTVTGGAPSADLFLSVEDMN